MTAGRKNSGQTQDWGTPEKYVKAIKRFFDGQIHLDPCSNCHSIVMAQVEYRLPAQDGLRLTWNFPTIYVNPPYGSDRERGTTIKSWLAKCEEASKFYGSEVLALVPVATNTGHWKKYVYGKAIAICFLYDTRLKFLENGQDTGKGAPMSCAMVYWGVHFQRFFDTFTEDGAVVNIENLIGIPIGRNGNGHQIEIVTLVGATM